MNLIDLQTKGWLSGDSLHDARIILSDKDANESTAKAPWIARFAMGFGAWLAGLFLTGFVAISLDTFGDHEVNFTVIGIFLVAGSVALVASVKKLFLKQLALSWCVAGYLLLMFGVIGLTDLDELGGFVTALILCAPVYWFSKNAVMRFLAVAWVWAMWLINAMDRGDEIFLVSGIFATLLLVIFGLSGRLSRPIWKPGITAAIIGLFVQIWFSFVQVGWPFRDFEGHLFLPTAMGVAIGFIVLLWYLIRPDDAKSSGWLIAFAVLLGALAMAESVGVVAGLGLLVVAHARGDRWLGWLATTALGIFLIHFYYNLNTTLMTKSLWLMGTGAAMLILRFTALHTSEKIVSP